MMNKCVPLSVRSHLVSRISLSLSLRIFLFASWHVIDQSGIRRNVGRRKRYGAKASRYFVIGAFSSWKRKNSKKSPKKNVRISKEDPQRMWIGTRRFVENKRRKSLSRKNEMFRGNSLHTDTLFFRDANLKELSSRSFNAIQHTLMFN